MNKEFFEEFGEAFGEAFEPETFFSKKRIVTAAAVAAIVIALAAGVGLVFNRESFQSFKQFLFAQSLPGGEVARVMRSPVMNPVPV